MILHLVLLAAATVARTDDPLVAGRSRTEWVARLQRAAEPGERMKAAGAIGELRWFAGPGVPALAEALAADPDAGVRAEAAAALGRVAAPKTAVPALTAALADRDPAVRAAAARGLAEYGPDAAPAVAKLLERLKADEPSDRVTAAVALTRVDPARGDGVRVLLALAAQAQDAETRTLAVSGLAIELGAAGALERHAAAVVPVLAALLKPGGAVEGDDGWYRQMTAADGLATIGPAAKAALPALTAALSDPNPDVRVRAARAVLRVEPGSAAGGRALVAALEAENPLHPDRFHVMGAVAAAGELGPAAKAAVPALVALLKADGVHGQVREAATHTLGQIGPAAREALPVLTADLTAADAKTQLDAARAVVRIDPRNAVAVAVLKEFAYEPGPGVWIDARMLALGTLLDVPSERGAVLRAAARALRSPGEFETRDGLRIGGALVMGREDLLRTVKVHSARLLAHAGDDARAAVPALVAALRDPDGMVRVEAAAALERLDPAALRAAGVR